MSIDPTGFSRGFLASYGDGLAGGGDALRWSLAAVLAREGGAWHVQHTVPQQQMRAAAGPLLDDGVHFLLTSSPLAYISLLSTCFDSTAGNRGLYAR
jgi:hypothetical protein